MKKLQKYFDVCKYFLNDVDTVDALIQQCQMTQQYLGELIQVKFELGILSSRYKRKYERKFQICCDIVNDGLRKRGSVSSNAIVIAKVESMFGDELKILRQKYDESNLKYECACDLYYAMLQRKDILVQIIDRWKFKDEYESCLIKNKEFMEAILRENT